MAAAGQEQEGTDTREEKAHYRFSNRGEVNFSGVRSWLERVWVKNSRTQTAHSSFCL